MRGTPVAALASIAGAATGFLAFFYVLATIVSTLGDKSIPAMTAFALGILFAILAPVFFWASRGQVRSVNRLAANGTPSVAMITGKSVRATASSDEYGRNRRTGPASYILHFRFALADTGKMTDGSSPVDKDLWDTTAEGDLVDVLYDSTDPTLTSLEDGEDFVRGAITATHLWKICTALAVAGIAGCYAIG